MCVQRECARAAGRVGRSHGGRSRKARQREDTVTYESDLETNRPRAPRHAARARPPAPPPHPAPRPETCPPCARRWLVGSRVLCVHLGVCLARRSDMRSERKVLIFFRAASWGAPMRNVREDTNTLERAVLKRRSGHNHSRGALLILSL